MLSWVFRHRHQLRALYGLPPEPAFAALLAAVEAYGDDDEELELEQAAPEPEPRPAPAPATRARGRLPVVELTPSRPRR